MLHGDTARILSNQSTAITTALFQVDDYDSVMLLVSTDAGTPVGQKLYVYGSFLVPGSPNQIDPTLPTSSTNPYAPMQVKDMNDMSVFNGTDGISIGGTGGIPASSTRLYEVNTNAVRNLHFKLVGSGAAVSLQMRTYSHGVT